MKKFRESVVSKSVSAIVLPLILMAVIVSIVGSYSFTRAMLVLYETGAVEIAQTARLDIDGSKIDDYAASGGTTQEYQAVWDRLDMLCNSTDATFIYVIRPDLTDYAHITFLFSTINANNSYTKYDFGYVRETTNDDYKKKYKRLYDGVSDSEIVLRNIGYIETDPHITAMVPLKGEDGQTTGILCVQRQMEDLTRVRNSFIIMVVAVFLFLTASVIVGQSAYLRKVLLKPLQRITEEAARFAKEESPASNKLCEMLKDRDEIWVLADSIDQMEERIVSYVEDLTKATAEKERINTELSLATRIQADMLPNIYPAFPDRKEFDIYGSMDPAKEVGGDFYDFFLIDDDHICLFIADVSGKGVPAALFMMASMIILANNAMIGKSPAQILEDTNVAICSNNKENMFVTVWLGILTISTGRLVAANAGHEYPALMMPGRKFELVSDKHGFVIGSFSEIKYQEYEIMMEPGSKLFLYTDGVAEASDKDQELFGTDRMLDALNKDVEAPCEQLLKNVRNAVDDFVKEEEQFDDLTMVCLEYNGNVC